MSKRVLTTLLLAALSIAVTPACSKKEIAKATFMPMGGIPFTVQAYDVSTATFDKAMTEIQEETERLEGVFSFHRDDSELATLNREGKAKVSPELLRVIQVGQLVSNATDGAFDVSVGPMIDLWRRCAELGRLPNEEEFESHKELVGFRFVSVNVNESRVTLQRKNMIVDLGGVAKGFIADRAADILQGHGIKRGIVDAGGNLALFNSVGEEPFKVGVRHPERPNERIAVLSIDSGAVVTSGCYERFYEIGGAHYCHILDPRTGQPAGELLSATIVASEGAYADALSTAVMVLGKEKGLQVINSLPDAKALIIWREGNELKWAVSNGLEDKVQFLVPGN